MSKLLGLTYISIRFLRHRHIHILPFMAVIIAITTVIVVISIMKGFDVDLQKKIRGTLEDITIYGIGRAGLQNYKEIIKKVKTVKGIKVVYPFIKTTVMLQNQAFIMNGFIEAIPQNIKLAHLSSKVSSNKIFVGRELQRMMFLKKGDPLWISTPIYQNGKWRFNTINFIVQGNFKSGLYEEDSSMVYINLKDAQTLLKTSNVTGIKIKVLKNTSLKIIIKELKKILPPYLSIFTWYDQRKDLFRAIKLERRIMMLILSFIVLITSFTIAGTFSNMVNEKKRQIGILMALGYSRQEIIYIFSMCIFLVAVFGIIVGNILSYFIVENINEISYEISSVIWKLFRVKIELFPTDIYYIDKIPVYYQIEYVANISIFVFLLCMIGGIYPIIKILKINPITVIRYE